MCYLKNVIVLYGTNNICIDIVQCLIDVGVCFQNYLPKVNIYSWNSSKGWVLLSEQDINQED